MQHRPHPAVRRTVVLAACAALTVAGAGAAPQAADAAAAPGDGQCAPYVGQPHLHVQRADHDGQVLTGTDRSDVLIAGSFRDVTLDGGGGRDFLCGGPGSDLLRGGPGADLLYGGAGDDRVDGGRGHDDVVVQNAGLAPDPQGVTDVVDGGPQGADLFFGAVTYAPGETLRIDAATGVATMPSGLHLVFSNVADFDGGQKATTFTGSGASELFTSGSRHTDISMGGGDDEVEADPGNVVDLGPGADHVDVTSYATVHGGPGRDGIEIGFEHRQHRAVPGVYRGGPGRDSLQIESNLNDGRVPVLDAVDATFAGGSGTDTVRLSLLDFAVTADLGAGTATWRRSRLGLSGLERLVGSSRGDDLTGSTADDQISGARGDDVIHGLGGDDVLVGGSGRDAIWGGPGHDRCAGEVTHLCEAP